MWRLFAEFKCRHAQVHHRCTWPDSGDGITNHPPPAEIDVNQAAGLGLIPSCGDPMPRLKGEASPSREFTI